MKKILFLFLILINFNTVSSQEISISDSAKISLITCSPGKEVYAKFGHTAIRVKDPKNNIDIVFNFGIFSFQTKNFYYKFIKGETDYQLGVYNTLDFLSEYEQRNSIVWEQNLNLNSVEKSALINSLLDNYKPENRLYRYNFVYDNCSTRPRDKIVAALHGFVKYASASDNKTYRQWIGAYIGNDTWLKFGIDVIFGLESDKLTTTNESMFLPEVLMANFQSAKITTNNDSTERKLVSEINVIVEKKKSDADDSISIVFRPLTISIALLIVGIIFTYFDFKNKKTNKTFDTVLQVATGLAGIIVFYLIVFSAHPLVKLNLNLLWLNPLNIIVAIIMWHRRFRMILFIYQIINISLLIGALFSFALSVQAFNICVFPLVILLLIRATSWFHHTKKRMVKRKKHRNINQPFPAFK
jgi:hypothetical protein